jgi:DNA-binding response OmpR family regulator
MNSERKRIIVVDDEPDLARLFCDSLQSAGYKTQAFDDPEVAIEHISTNNSKISLVITDWKMPKLNGLELTKRISQIDDKIKVMLMSAYELDQDQLREINKNDYLRKPVHMSKLIDSIKLQLNPSSHEE